MQNKGLDAGKLVNACAGSKYLISKCNFKNAPIFTKSSSYPTKYLQNAIFTRIPRAKYFHTFRLSNMLIKVYFVVENPHVKKSHFHEVRMYNYRPYLLHRNPWPSILCYTSGKLIFLVLSAFLTISAF